MAFCFVSVVRISVPLVTRSTLEVVLPEYAVPKLTAKSKSKLAQISEVCKTSVPYFSIWQLLQAVPIPHS